MSAEAGTTSAGRPHDEPERLYTPAEVAKLWGISRWSVYAWLGGKQAKLHGVKIGNRVRIPQSEISRLTREGKEAHAIQQQGVQRPCQ
jgi:excisionase family DNA binding protein